MERLHRFEQFKASSSALFHRSTALIVFPRRWLRNGLAAVAIGLASVGGGWFYFSRQVAEPIATTSNPPPLSVSTLVVTRVTIAGTQVVTGTVEPIEVVTTTSRVAGQIVSLPVNAGDRVKAG
jgi:HlyD family secretion protein